jgi:hypothetical protein
MTAADRRRHWAAETVARLSAGLDVPRYGTAEWLDYGGPARDRARFAALIVAAEAWASDGDDLPDRLERDVAVLHAAWEEREAEWMADAVWPEVARKAKADAIRAIEREEHMAAKVAEWARIDAQWRERRDGDAA